MKRNRPALSDEQLSDFLLRHRLPAEFRRTAETHFSPLASQLPELRGDRSVLLLGINGAQGTGKSTLAEFLRLATESMFNWHVAVLSIDDFYYTLEERRTLAKTVHPLFKTRGVPGTHDTRMLAQCLDQLRQLDTNELAALPRFDKATDDRADESRWPLVKGPIDLIIIEGWCVGSVAQTSDELQVPINRLEREEDSDRTWRFYVNAQLETKYKPIFDQLDALIFLRAPSFDAILRWRTEQEEKLAAVSPEHSSGLMNNEQIERFLQYYERLTRVNLEQLPNSSDIVFNLDEAHSMSKAEVLR